MKQRRRRIIAALLAAFAAGAPATGTALAADPYTLQATEDNFVRVTAPSTVQTENIVLRAGYAHDRELRAYVKFTSPDAGTGVLRIYVERSNGKTTRVFTAGSGWTESTLTWNNKPPTGAEVATFTSGWDQFVQVAVPVAAGANTYEIRKYVGTYPGTTSANGDNEVSKMASSEATNAARRPTLTVTPAPPPPPPCEGVDVPAGASLPAAASAQPAGTTFCLTAGTYNIGSTPVTAQNGDVFQGAGRNATFIDGNDVAEHLIVPASGAVYTVRLLSASGAQGDALCHPDCGRAFKSGAGVVAESIECYDNSNQCFGGGGDVTMHDVHCYGNSEEYSWRESESGACAKVVRGGSLLVDQGSVIEGNNWNGLWCDFCDGADSSFVVRDSIIRNNGYKGISYEVSGANAAFGLVENNEITGNWWRYAINGTPNNRPAGVTCNDCRDLEIRGNTFGGTALDGLGQRRAVSLIDSSRADTAYGYSGLPGVFIHDNDLNGDVIVGCSLPGVTCSNNS